MLAVAPQDVRRKDSIFKDSTNSKLFRVSWETAISANSDWVLISFVYFYLFLFVFVFVTSF